MTEDLLEHVQKKGPIIFIDHDLLHSLDQLKLVELLKVLLIQLIPAGLLASMQNPVDAAEALVAPFVQLQVEEGHAQGVHVELLVAHVPLEVLVGNKARRAPNALSVFGLVERNQPKVDVLKLVEFIVVEPSEGHL